MRRALTSCIAVGAAAATASLALAAPHHDDLPTERGARAVHDPAPRLVVADGVVGKVAVVDLARRKVLTRLRIAEPASLWPVGDGRHVLAGQSNANRVDVIDAGSWSVEHGDHQHHYIRPPRKRAPILGPTPIHLVEHGDRFAVFTDGDGVGTVQTHANVGRGAKGARRVASGAPHHGVAVPFGTRTLVSLPDPAGGSPIGVGVAGPRGAIVQRFEQCPGLHGEAAVGRNTVLFACADGYLAVTLRGSRITAAKTAAVSDGAGLRRSSTLSSADGLPYAIGNLGNRAFVRVTPAGGPANVIELDVDHGAFALDGASRSLLTVTVDGQLTQIDPVSGAVTARVPVAQPYSLAGAFSIPRPQIALGPERRAYVSDPASGRVTEVATNPLRVTRTIAVGGVPRSLAVLGGGR
ncbi:MAG: hypothetical protein AB7V42_08510 [Thermoleophilia bacterium]